MSIDKDTKITGKEYWRSLDQIADSPEYRTFLEREFPEGASELRDYPSRRKFLTLMGASLAFAGLAGCRRPVEKVIPYVTQPEEIIPGKPQFYATTMPFGSSSFGLVVESHEGRPTKIEGNPLHPSTKGSSNSLIQSSILSLYDPDRAKTPRQGESEKSWQDFLNFWKNHSETFASNGGQNLAVISEEFSSPTLDRLAEEFKSSYPNSTWVPFEPVNDENIISGIEAATNKKLRPVYDFSNVDVVLSLDSDFLLTESDNISNSKSFSSARNIEDENGKMNRLYIVESTFSTTGSMADHRLRLNSGRIGAFTLAVAAELVKKGLRISGYDESVAQEISGFNPEWIEAVAEDLINSKSRNILIAGRKQPAAVHTLVCAINSALGNNGNTIRYYDVSKFSLSNSEKYSNLNTSIDSGDINTLVIIGGNPVYNAPSDFDFKGILSKVSNVIHFSTDFNETSIESNWHLPQSHYLESWGDARAIDGTSSTIQPMISPLFESKSISEFFGLLATGQENSGYELVRSTWQNLLSRNDFEKNWRKVLHDGIFENSSASPVNVNMYPNIIRDFLNTNPITDSIVDISNLELVFITSPSLYDGRYANNGWMQELSDPITKLTWDNAALLSPSTAEGLELKEEDLVLIEYKGKELQLPVVIVPGQADFTVAVEPGYGRTAAGRVGNNVGFDVNPLRTSEAWNIDSGVTLTKSEGKYLLSRTQNHHSMEGRPIVREADIEDYKHHPEFAEEMVEVPHEKSMWKEHSYDEGYQWGMTVDLNTCTGCNACTVACQSENNIPIVGKEQVRNGREMAWIRIDRYFTGDVDEPEMVHQPVGCQHCELAPCEQVCPVAATVHDEEGLNTMVYNRCIGTRYCSNNCPFKVRRFNFFNYTNDIPEIVKMAQNPDVTVRFRGVMEKCTFCVQRISRAKITAKNEDRVVKDGEVTTACQQTCPADAIVFGDINDPDSKVAKVKKQNRNYHMLKELNLKARNSYLAKIRNPNPKLKNA